MNECLSVSLPAKFCMAGFIDGQSGLRFGLHDYDSPRTAPEVIHALVFISRQPEAGRSGLFMSFSRPRQPPAVAPAKPLEMALPKAAEKMSCPAWQWVPEMSAPTSGPGSAGTVQPLPPAMTEIAGSQPQGPLTLTQEEAKFVPRWFLRGKVLSANSMVPPWLAAEPGQPSHPAGPVHLPRRPPYF